MTSTTLHPPLSSLDDHFTDSEGVRIHYMAGGEGPLIVFIHGFPDFWYSWRHQLGHFVGTNRVAAMDTRGYNLSDQPEGQDNYVMDLLIGDVAAVLRNENRTSAVIVGHDWGGATAWNFASTFPEMTDRLVIINTPHPASMAREMKRPESQQRDSLAYADNFRKPNSHTLFNAEALSIFMSRGDEETQRHYYEAFMATSLEAAMNYYRANTGSSRGTAVQAPVLQFHGLDDPALLTAGVNSTWEHLTSTWTLVTVPNAGHWPHHDHPNLVTSTMSNWLAQPMSELAPDRQPPAQTLGTSEIPGATCCEPASKTPVAAQAVTPIPEPGGCCS